jgi:hypothetical protein
MERTIRVDELVPGDVIYNVWNRGMGGRSLKIVSYDGKYIHCLWEGSWVRVQFGENLRLRIRRKPHRKVRLIERGGELV